MFDDIISSVNDLLGGANGLGDLSNLGGAGDILQDLQGHISPDLFNQLTELASQHGIDPN
jgi:hypothetical protein